VYAKDADFVYLRSLIRRRSAIVVEESKDYLLESRLAPVAREEGLDSIGALVRRLQAGSSKLETRVVEAMTTNETLFFRDVGPFEALRDVVIPALLKARGGADLRIWSAASSTGQEAYSIAMLLDDSFPSLDKSRVKILATDLTEPVLEYGRRGVYRQLEVNRGLPSSMLLKYFDRDGAFWRVREPLRKQVTFKQMNLIEAWPEMPRMDVVFLRNVLIYFDTDTKRMILSRVRKILAPDGYLFLGGAETTLNSEGSFERVQRDRIVFYRPKKELP
jgi:chemotaxis protein methyltransferase CheR